MNSPLAGVNILILHTSYGTTTDSLGNFLLNIKPGRYQIRFSYVGYEAESREIDVAAEDRNFYVNISLKPAAYVTDEVTVSADRYLTSPSLHTVKAKDLQSIPNLHSDIIRSVTILPGVTSNNELTSAYNVRGQNFDANLVYLNGYEIYRPYLVQQGIEESQSAINENMVEDFEFYNGAFPIEFGDKMSSVLVINYKRDESTILGGEANADLFNLGVTLHDKTWGLNWSAGFRYAYPSSFTRALQTKGNYKPTYVDFQFFGSYNLSNNFRVELLAMTSRNSFDLTPQSWSGDFQMFFQDYKRITLEFAGTNDYRYYSDLLGLRVTARLNSSSSLSTSLAYYSDREFYNKNLSYDVYYSPNAREPQDNLRYIQTGYEYAGNSLEMDRLELKTDFHSDHGTHDTEAGVAIRYSLMDNLLDESNYTNLPMIVPYSAKARQDVNFNSLSAYLGEDIHLSPDFTSTLGMRVLKYYFNGEFLVSPRAGISYRPDTLNLLSFGWGYYYQPPYFYETRDKSPDTAGTLLSQSAIHYVLRYENRFRKNAKLLAEVYYESLSRLIPWYTNQLELTYGDKNDYEGYAYGFDLQYEGELVEGLDTWIGYSYLNAKDRETDGSSPYQRSLLDQTHTIRIFLQDKMIVLPNSQAHVRLLFGTGYLYHPLVSVPSATQRGSYQMVPDCNQVLEYPFYFRVDMGLTYKLVLGDRRSVTLNAEVLNVFDKQNFISYSWYYVYPESSHPIPVPNLLSARYFNVGFRVEF